MNGNCNRRYLVWIVICQRQIWLSRFASTLQGPQGQPTLVNAQNSHPVYSYRPIDSHSDQSFMTIEQMLPLFLSSLSRLYMTSCHCITILVKSRIVCLKHKAVSTSPQVPQGLSVSLVLCACLNLLAQGVAPLFWWLCVWAYFAA